MVFSGDVLVVATARRAKVLLRVVVARLITVGRRKCTLKKEEDPKLKC